MNVAHPRAGGMIVLIVALAVVWAAAPSAGPLAYSAGWYATFAAHLSQRRPWVLTALQPLGAPASRPWQVSAARTFSAVT